MRSDKTVESTKTEMQVNEEGGLTAEPAVAEEGPGSDLTPNGESLPGEPGSTDTGRTVGSGGGEGPAGVGTGSGGKSVHSDALKFAGLLAFVVIVGIVLFLAWPYVSDVFTEGGPERLVERVRDAGPAGVFILLGMQFLQIVVAFIPGEVVQLAAGLMYGPWLGTLIILIGCILSSACVYQLVHRLGAPFVQGMVSTEHLGKFKAFEESGKLDIVVFVLFLIPAMPKDVFTYLVPLTDMEMKRFLILSNVGRIPGILASTYAAHGFAEGQLVGPIVVLVVVVVLAVLGIVFRNRIMEAFGKRK